MQYCPGSLVADPNKNPMDWFSGQAKNADATIVGLGLTILLEGEEGEAIASTDKGDNLSMQLPENQMEYLRKVSRKAKQGGKPLIAVIFSGCPLDLTEICELADAVIYAWYPGEEGGQALADIIFGDVSPSGKLPITFPRSKEDLPPYKDYSMQGRTYRYMTKDPLYPFGFGLSYASFELGAATLSQSELEDGQTVEVSVEVANKSDMKADDVLQLYVSLLDVDEIEVPQFELKTFKRISLDGGAAEEVTFTLRPEMFYYINQDGDKVPYTGSAAIFVGNASPGNRSLELGASVQRCELNIK
jgi:beta-glucosidase